MLSSENNKDHEHDHEHDPNKHADEEELFCPEDLNDFFGQPLSYKKGLLLLKQLFEEAERQNSFTRYSEDGSLSVGHRKRPSYVLGLTVTNCFLLEDPENEDETSEVEDFLGEDDYFSDDEEE